MEKGLVIGRGSGTRVGLPRAMCENAAAVSVQPLHRNGGLTNWVRCKCGMGLAQAAGSAGGILAGQRRHGVDHLTVEKRRR